GEQPQILLRIARNLGYSLRNLSPYRHRGLRNFMPIVNKSRSKKNTATQGISGLRVSDRHVKVVVSQMPQKNQVAQEQP
ncbi:hypothetical protein SUGI_0251430, partial [Cryptomeria japonica]